MKVLHTLALALGILSSTCIGNDNFTFTLEDTPEAIIIHTSRYDMQIPREGVGMSVLRNNSVVLDLPPVALSASPRARLPRLRRVSRSDDLVAFEYDGVRVHLQPSSRSVAVTTWFHQPGPSTLVSLRWRLNTSGLWYGGGFQGLSDEHVLPLNSARVRVDSFASRGSTQGTPVWYATGGVGIWVKSPHDFRYAINQETNGTPDGLFTLEIPSASSVNYVLFIEDNIREVVRRVLREVGWPKSIPPFEYMKLPIYTTWVEYKGDIDQAKILQFAGKIQSNRMPCGVIEIDMGWETKYGDLEFDRSKFPDPKAMVDELHRRGLRVTLWVSNFVNVDSATFQQHREDGVLARDASGNVGLSGWWAGVAGVWDFTLPRAAVEFRSRLLRLQELYGIDGFKFDSGEANLVPRDLRTYVPITPMEYADYFNREAVAYFPWNESRVGVYSQATGIVQRLQDKQSSWGIRNGLEALISQAFTVSLRGFFHVMPDIVGGNEYGGKVDKELLVRWAQASALMPFLQFGRGPWNFDDETVRLVREASQLHVNFAPYIYRLAENGRDAGEPIIAPLWYHYPGDPETFPIVDQYMLGPSVLAAPVLRQGATSRDVYLPKGTWFDYTRKTRIVGPTWLRAYPAPLDTLPLFMQEGFQLPTQR